MIGEWSVLKVGDKIYVPNQKLPAINLTDNKYEYEQEDFLWKPIEYIVSSIDGNDIYVDDDNEYFDIGVTHFTDYNEALDWCKNKNATDNTKGGKE